MDETDEPDKPDESQDFLFEGAQIHPLELNEEQWQAIRAMAKQIMERDKVAYFQAAIIAYVEWLEMLGTEDTKH